jgi:hypothetical protein
LDVQIATANRFLVIVWEASAAGEVR